MAEQISHKRSLRVKRLDEDKKRLLKEYYKLSDETNGSLEDKASDSIPTTPEVTAEPNEEDVDTDNSVKEAISVNGSTTSEQQINEMTLQEILQIHNRLVGQEIEMSNSIKNTIYDNYYDLVKVNTLLEGLVNRESNQTKSDKHNRVEALLGQLQTLNEP